MNNQKTNWKYLSIVIILFFITGGGILGYNYWWLAKQEVKFSEIKKENKLKVEGGFEEVSLAELKEGDNKIGDIEIKKITFSKLKPVKIAQSIEADGIINIIEYEISINKLNIEDVYRTGLRDYTIYYNNKKISKNDLLPTAPSPEVLSFDYGGKTYIIITSETGGSGGTWTIYEFYLIDNNNLRQISTPEGYAFSFEENLGYNIIGYENFLYTISTSRGRAGMCCPWEYLKIYALDINKKIESDEENFAAACSGSDPYGCFISPKAFSLVEKDKTLYIKINDGYHYSVWDTENEECLKYDICPAISYIGIDEYYLLKNGKIIRKNDEFKNNYLQLTSQYTELLQNENWRKLCKEKGEWCRIVNDWPSPLLGITLNLIFAGEEKIAWKYFFEDFNRLSLKYPLEVKLDSNKIKEDVDGQLRERNSN